MWRDRCGGIGVEGYGRRDRCGGIRTEGYGFGPRGVAFGRFVFSLHSLSASVVASVPVLTHVHRSAPRSCHMRKVSCHMRKVPAIYRRCPPFHIRKFSASPKQGEASI